MKTIQETAYAKINLGLDILGRRDDGYHEVSMIMQSVGLCDEITISEGSGAGSIELSTNVPELSCGRDNLAYKAAALLAEQCGIVPNVHLTLNKKIFLAAGLAGGSSDAAAVLRGLNRYWQLGLTAKDLEQLGARLGSDIPFCISGGTALATGRGELLTPLPQLPETWVVLAKLRGVEVSTAWVYQHYNADRVVHAPCIWQLREHLEAGARALVPYMGNVLETVTIPAQPQIAAIKAALLGGGALVALMSGSGPTVFALCASEAAARQAEQAVQGFDVETAITTTIGRKE